MKTLCTKIILVAMLSQSAFTLNGCKPAETTPEYQQLLDVMLLDHASYTGGCANYIIQINGRFALTRGSLSGRKLSEEAVRAYRDRNEIELASRYLMAYYCDQEPKIKVIEQAGPEAIRYVNEKIGSQVPAGQ